MARNTPTTVRGHLLPHQVDAAIEASAQPVRKTLRRSLLMVRACSAGCQISPCRHAQSGKHRLIGTHLFGLQPRGLNRGSGGYKERRDFALPPLVSGRRVVAAVDRPSQGWGAVFFVLEVQ